MEAPWTKTVDQVQTNLEVSLETGLTKDEVKKRQEAYGFNELEKEEGTSFWELVLEQFDDPLVKILLVAAVVSALIVINETLELGESFSLAHFVEPGVILLILILNAIVGVWQESNAEKSLEGMLSNSF
mmetsp:Transcript_125/g.193  ORF Transcript_125/g.193 Transcript_125/m.193 type:complete len:129 (-) Transcript_125:148-534(-)